MQYLMPDISLLPFGAHRPRLAADVFVASGARLIGDVTIANASSIWFNAVIRADVQYVRIGQHTNIQDNSVVHVTGGGHPTIIGDHVTVGHSAIIHACTIGNLCLIGMGATVLDGVEVGEESLVGAGALLPPGKRYPARSLIIGSPAVVKRPLTNEVLASLRASAEHYTALRLQYFPRS